MRKSSKILALVLTLVMLLGVIAVYAFADETPAAQQPVTRLTGTGITHFNKGDWEFEVNSFKLHWKASEGTSPSGEWGLTAKNFSRFDTKETVNAEGVTVNSYGSFYHDKTIEGEYDSTRATGPYFDFANRLNAGTTQSYKYIVYDWDLSTDKYIDANGALTDEPTDADGNPHKLAYGGSYTFTTRAGDGHYTTGRDLIKGGLGVDADGPYITFTVNGQNATARLKDDINVWNHITIVFYFDHTVDYTKAGDETVYTGTRAECTAAEGTIVATHYAESKVHVYVDGEHVVTGPLGLGEDDINSAMFERYFFGARWSAPGNGTNTSFANSYDNVTCHYYANDYAGPMATAFAGGSAPKALGEYDDMVFNNTYVYPAPNTPVATITTLAGVTTNYYMLSGAVNSLEENCTLTLLNGTTLKDYNAYFPFKVVCPRDAFSVDSSTYTHGSYKGTDGNDGGYYEVEEADTFIPVYFYVDKDAAENDGDPFEFLGEDQYDIPVGQSAKFPTNEVAGITDFILDENNNYTLFTGWKGIIFDESAGTSTPLDPDYVFTGNEEFFSSGYVALYPTYETGKLLYGIYDSDGNLKPDSLGGYTQYSNPAVIATETRAQIDKGNSTIYLRLLNDVIVDNANTFSLAVNTSPKLYLDLNGHTLALSSREKAQTGFSFGWSAGLYLYSTQPGGRIFHSSATGGTGMISITGSNHVYLGKVKDPITGIIADGNNLSVYAEALVSYGGREYASNLHIDGGYYYGFEGADVAFIPLAHNALFDAKNATFFVEDGRPIFSTNKRSVTATHNNIKSKFETDLGGVMTLDVNVVNCKLIAGTDGKGSIFGELYKGAQINITNSEIYGSMELSLRTTGTPQYTMGDEYALLGTVNLGDGVKFTDTAVYTHIKYADGFVAVSYAGSADPITMNYYKVNYEELLPAEGTFDTAIAIATTDPLVKQIVTSAGMPQATITYLNHDGTLIETVTEYVGNDVLGPYLKVTEIDLDNPWFNLAFTYWADATTGEKVDFVNMADGTTITVKAACETPVADVFAYSNMTFMTKFAANIYLPAIEKDATTITITENGKNYIISAVSHFNKNKADVTGSANIVIGGDDYIRFTYSYPDAADYNPVDCTYYITFTVTEEGNEANTVTVNQEPIINKYNEPSSYLIYTLENAATEADKKLIANVIQYCNAVYDYKYTVAGVADTKEANIVNHQKLVDIIAKDEYKGYVTDIESADFDAILAAEKLDLSIPAGLAEHVEGITLHIRSGMPGLAVVPVDGYETTKLYSVKVNAGKFANTNATVIALAPDHPLAPGSDGAVNPNANYIKDTESIGIWMNIQTYLPAYYGANTFTFTFKVDNGTEEYDVYSVDYNIATYILAVEADADSSALDLQAAKLARAFRAYAECALEFVTTPEQ